MQDISLIDVDSKIPNLALMKISAYHKGIGDSVRFYDPGRATPDKIYMSKVFDFTPDFRFFPTRPDCEISKGGTGYDPGAKLPFPDYDRIMPDYSLYGCDYALGRFTRGCPNSCPWCVVPKMDGNDVRHVADLGDFWSGQRVVRLLDDNIMADPDEFCRDCEQLSNAGVHVIWDALDIRLVTDQTAEALVSVKLEKHLHFAWDGHAQDEYIEPGIRLLSKHGLKPWRLMFYVLVGFNTTREYDLERVYKLRDLGAHPFVMPFNKSDPYQRRLARWCNNKVIFKSTKTFDDYRG